MGAREAVSRVSYDSAQRETTRTLKASLMSPHRLPVVSTWYTMRFGCDGVSGDDEEGSGSDGVGDMVVVGGEEVCCSLTCVG